MSLTNLSMLGLYLPLLLIAYYNPFFKGNGFRKLLLLVASIALYTFCEPVYVLLLILMILINYLLVKLSDHKKSKVYRVIAVGIDVFILLFFKYMNKVLVLGLFSANFSTIVFPIGLSYFIFRIISYVVDSSNEKEGSFIDAAIYSANFLTIVSGPLSTYKEELPFIREKRKNSFGVAYVGLERLMIGFGKKIIIADSLCELSDYCFASSNISVVLSWAGAISYTLQLYFDFSGYTDIVLGVGNLFGFDLPENFNDPYMAKSISDFWKKWHMSLTKWLTRYIYIPLGGSRVSSVSAHVFNLFVVWLITGIWHGSHLTFIVWAMIYFVIQVLEKYAGLSQFLNKFHVGRIFTLFIIVVEWVIFRSESLSEAFSYIGAMFACNQNSLYCEGDWMAISHFTIPILLGITFATNIGRKIKNIASGKIVFNILYNICLISIFLLCLLIIISGGYSAPLYAGF